MLDIKYIKENINIVKEKLKNRNENIDTIEKLLDIYKNINLDNQKLDELIHLQKTLSNRYGILKTNKQNIIPLENEIKSIKEQITKLKDSINYQENLYLELIYSLPNLYDDLTPIGENENENLIIEKKGIIPTFDFEPKQHFDIGINSNIIDFERAVKISKTRFSSFRGIAAKLERALINYMLDFNSKRGFEEWTVPFVANSNTLLGTGQLPKFEDDLYKIENENLYLIPTSEVSLTNLYNNEIIKKEELPLLMTSYTPCFRREAGAAGRDTRGLIRQHQFNKVEMVAITTQEQSEEIFNKMVDCASDLLTSLGLPHQKVQLCSGDLGFSASKTIDLEVWLPGQNKYREISSISNTKDFQSRRAKIRYKENKTNMFCHTLNGSSLAVGRTIVAILENYQKSDGSFEIPKVLEKYM